MQFTEFTPDEAATGSVAAVRAPATPATLAELFEPPSSSSSVANVGREVCKVKVRTSIESVRRTFVDFVPAGGQAAVEITSFNDLPTPARTDVYGELSNLSLLGT